MPKRDEVRYEITLGESGQLSILRRPVSANVSALAKDMTGEHLKAAGILPWGGRVKWCVYCGNDSDNKQTTEAWTELDAGLQVCGLQNFTVTRGECE
jgi:hypothetical protein